MNRANTLFNPTRRRLLQGAIALPLAWSARHVAASTGGAGGVPLAPASIAAPLAAVSGPPKSLKLFNTHTRETLAGEFFTSGNYVPGVLKQLDVLLRDHRSGESHPIDPRLFDVMHQLAGMANAEPAFEIISCYRSPASNEKLRAAGGGVAKNSLHLQGKAIDVRLRGVSCKRLRDLALELKPGGVGYYAKSDFVHLDTGRVRTWNG